MLYIELNIIKQKFGGIKKSHESEVQNGKIDENVQ